MVEYKIKGHKIAFYDDIKETPISSFTQFKKYLTIAAAIDPRPDVPLGYFDESIAKINQFLDTESKDYIRQELMNIRQSVFSRMVALDISSLAIASIVGYVDGEEVDCKTEQDLEDISKNYLSKATLRVQTEILNHVKKNFLMQ